MAFDLSTYLQKSSLDLITASRLIQSFENHMEKMQTQYESQFKMIENEATQLAEKCDISVEYKQHRQRERKRFYEETTEDDAVLDARKKFIVETYLVSLDSIINSTSIRFQNFNNVAAKFSCLDPKYFDSADNINRWKEITLCSMHTCFFKRFKYLV